MAVVGTRLSFDIQDNRTIFYTMHSRDAENARDELARQIRHVNGDGYKPMNPILEAVGIISLERSTDPNEKALGKIMAGMDGLSGEIQSLRTTGAQISLNAVGGFYQSPPSVLESTGSPGKYVNFFTETPPTHVTALSGDSLAKSRIVRALMDTGDSGGGEKPQAIRTKPEK